ncbi:hypothetical protein HS088_TW03G00755 [Tripterygium wilfordii]|uniref:AMP-activated protein kinase glycogen-binding domain-containing protein n=1 Tax=Tripterygium wilfordii TaxID=458696 RepID=A0A7J7DVU6_TRIWF|nr:hypothetical protein HS088_TW03G00755 [Tripterygium wilfordii]
MISNSFSHFPSFCLICPCKYQHHQPLQRHLCWNTASQNRPPVHFTIRASSIENSSSRRGRKVKSNAELCDEIREFVIAAGFPVGHVPSMKELSEHGRNDLANIVRRRGYKLVRELLANSIQTDVVKSNTDAISTEKQDETDNHEDKLADNIDGLLKDSGAEESTRVEESAKEMERLSKVPSEKNAKDAHSRRHVALASKESTLTMRDDRSSTEGLQEPAVYTDQALDVETSKRDNQTEIDRLKFMLHQKELELSMLKEQIEKEKLAFTVLQAHAETEINKAQKLIPDKDAELHSAEEGLSGLEEVEIHYCGDGEIVEVTGSFNGWHHRIKMDPQLSSSIMDPIRSRTFRVWSTVLWLYPGIYEIKFVVDGQWKVDPQRESATKDGICNNILRVKR